MYNLLEGATLYVPTAVRSNILVINSYYCFQDKRRERNIYFTLINDEEVITDKHVIAMLM